jgi:hypothetical protein
MESKNKNFPNGGFPHIIEKTEKQISKEEQNRHKAFDDNPDAPQLSTIMERRRRKRPLFALSGKK